MRLDDEYGEDQISSDQPLLRDKTDKFFTMTPESRRNLAYGLISAFNGVLYYAVSEAGGENLEKLFKMDGEKSEIMINVVSGISCLVYTMFFYKTLESLTLKPKSLQEIFLTILAPFAAASFLIAGMEGAEKLNFIPYAMVIAVGLLLFGFRIINCVDGSVKFPERLSMIKKDAQEAWQIRNYSEIIRILIATSVSVGFSLASTDAIYGSIQTLLKLIKLPAGSYIDVLSYISSILGAIGTLPMTLYWTHRGLKQLTNSGAVDSNGKIADPTDIYTYLGLIAVSAIILGVLGSATGSVSHVFGKLGTPAEVVRVGSSTVYATCAGTPGMSTLLRNFSNLFSKTPKHSHQTRAVADIESTEINSSSFDHRGPS